MATVFGKLNLKDQAIVVVINSPHSFEDELRQLTGVTIVRDTRGLKSVEFAGFVCPLTPLEGHLRELGGDVRHEGDFIGHYITEFLYPAGLTRSLQIWLGSLALLSNLLIYGYFLLPKLHGKATRPGPT